MPIQYSVDLEEDTSPEKHPTCGSGVRGRRRRGHRTERTRGGGETSSRPKPPRLHSVAKDAADADDQVSEYSYTYELVEVEVPVARKPASASSSGPARAKQPRKPLADRIAEVRSRAQSVASSRGRSTSADAGGGHHFTTTTSQGGRCTRGGGEQDSAPSKSQGKQCSREGEEQP